MKLCVWGATSSCRVSPLTTCWQVCLWLKLCSCLMPTTKSTVFWQKYRIQNILYRREFPKVVPPVIHCTVTTATKRTRQTCYRANCCLLTIFVDLGTKLPLVRPVATSRIRNLRPEGRSWYCTARVCPGSIAISLACCVTRRSYNTLIFLSRILPHTFTILVNTLLFFKLRPPNQFRQPKGEYALKKTHPMF